MPRNPGNSPDFQFFTHKTRDLKSWGIPSTPNTMLCSHHDREASTRNINLRIASRRAFDLRIVASFPSRLLSSITARETFRRKKLSTSRNTGDSRDLLFCACYLSRKSGTGILKNIVGDLRARRGNQRINSAQIIPCPPFCF